MDNTNNHARYIIVEGNIGAGKSTFLKVIQNYLQLPVIFEPVEKWQSVGGCENVLEKFYQDTNRWAYTFQSYAFITRILALEEGLKSNNDHIVILERSVFSDRYCFAKNCYEQGFMSALEWQLYQEWFSWLVETVMTKPSGFIYLQANPTTCYQRLCKRGRTEESPVSLEYLQQLHDKHEQWLVHKEGVAHYVKDLPVLIFDGNKDFEYDMQAKSLFLQYITKFLSTQIEYKHTRAFNLSL